MGLSRFISKDKIEKFVIAMLALVFLLFAGLYVVFPIFVFPILCGIIFLSHLFLFKQKYRLYSVAFYTPLAKLMGIQGFSLGSFFTWVIIIYLFVCLFDILFLNKEKKLNFLNYFFTRNAIRAYTFFLFYLAIVLLVNISSVDILKAGSAIVCFLIPVLYFLDFKSEKKFVAISLYFAIGLMLANVFAFVFVYVFSPYTTSFLERYVSNYANVLVSYGISSFRFPGLPGDPNHNALHILFSSLFLIIAMFKNKKIHWLSIIIIVLLQFFAVIGQSKTYFICLIVICFFLIWYLPPKEKRLPFFSFSIIIALCVFMTVISFEDIAKIFIRITFVDPRKNLLETITSDRLSLWCTYTNAFFGNIINLLLGHGIDTTGAFNMSAHNLLIQVVWEYGLLSLPILCYLFLLLFNAQGIKKQKIFILPFVIVLIFGFSLHILYDEVLYLSMLIMCCFNDKNINDKLLYFGSNDYYLQMEVYV